MSNSSYKWVVVLVVINGVLIEIDNAYKHSMNISNVVMSSAALIRLPKSFHHSPFAETPLVHEFDRMTLTTGTIMFQEN